MVLRWFHCESYRFLCPGCEVEAHTSPGYEPSCSIMSSPEASYNSYNLRKYSLPHSLPRHGEFSNTANPPGLPVSGFITSSFSLIERLAKRLYPPRAIPFEWA